MPVSLANLITHAGGDEKSPSDGISRISSLGDDPLPANRPVAWDLNSLPNTPLLDPNLLPRGLAPQERLNGLTGTDLDADSDLARLLDALVDFALPFGFVSLALSLTLLLSSNFFLSFVLLLLFLLILPLSPPLNAFHRTICQTFLHPYIPMSLFLLTFRPWTTARASYRSPASRSIFDPSSPSPFVDCTTSRLFRRHPLRVAGTF